MKTLLAYFKAFAHISDMANIHYEAMTALTDSFSNGSWQILMHLIGLKFVNVYYYMLIVLLVLYMYQFYVSAR